jgi:hypothetical protein
MTKLSNEIRELSLDELEAVSGARINLGQFAWFHGPRPHAPGTVGGGDTIDTNMEVNSNLPGAGPWGN